MPWLNREFENYGINIAKRNKKNAIPNRNKDNAKERGNKISDLSKTKNERK